MRRFQVGCAVALLAGQAWADCGADQLVMTCRIDGKTTAVHLCQGPDSVRYRYGTPGKSADLVLTSTLAELEYLPWNGIGRSIYEEVTFRNAGYAYVVWAALDRQITEDDPGEQLSGGVEVRQGDKVVASLICEPFTIDARIDALYEAKTRAGQCWEPTDFTWRRC